MVSSPLYPNRLEVVAADVVVASHVRVFNRGHTTYDWQHTSTWCNASPARSGTARPSWICLCPCGDRVMAQVLAVVPSAGLEAVLVAVELVLDSGTPSGGVSVEHVLNVLARLNAPEQPEQAETGLRLKEAPKADTARYDRLRPTHHDGQEINHA